MDLLQRSQLKQWLPDFMQLGSAGDDCHELT
jgi:hypothetical protein